MLSREAQDSELLSGRLDAARLTKITETLVPAETVDDWFLCGPYAMVIYLRQALLDQGIQTDQVNSELFHVGKSPSEWRTTSTDSGDGSDVTISLDRRQSTFKLKSDDVPVLEAALRVRSDAPFACRGGVCGTCRAKVVGGEVAIDSNYAPEPEETEQGYVLTCGSHPTTATVKLDLNT